MNEVVNEARMSGDPRHSRSARAKRATLCRVLGHKPDPFQGWFGPAGSNDEDGETFDLCICARCFVSLDSGAA